LIIWIDHIFIFSDEPDEAADEFLAHGFSEGPARKHPGQVTANRKFYFENFFFEILYVTAPSELQNEVVVAAGLADRANFQQNGKSPFGLCFLDSWKSDSLFRGCKAYQPYYLPEGLTI
jgi:hypothetical protein